MATGWGTLIAGWGGVGTAVCGRNSADAGAARKALVYSSPVNERTEDSTHDCETHRGAFEEPYERTDSHVDDKAADPSQTFNWTNTNDINKFNY